MARVADVAIDPRVAGGGAVFTYLAPDDLTVGAACFVPLGTRSLLGFVVRVYDQTDLEHLKPIGVRVEDLSLPASLVELTEFVAREYLCDLPAALSAATPPGFRDRIVSGWTLTEEAPATQQEALLIAPTTPDWRSLTTAQQETLRVMRESGGALVETATKKIPARMQTALRLLQAKGYVRESRHLIPFAERRKAPDLLRINPDRDRIERFLKEEGARKPAQALTLMRLQTVESAAALAPSEIKALAGVTDSTLKSLVDAGLLEKIGAGSVAIASPPRPNPHQQLAIDAIEAAIHAGESARFLLFGVTGSGKTEVYLRSAATALAQGRQVLYLVPEIALAAQVVAQLRERFGSAVAILHSDLSPRERLQNWTAIRRGEASVVLGARSALFAPLTRLGLIVVDEEHEATYKQESVPRYHAKRVALQLGALHRCPVVLGSATPSIESFYDAERDALTLLSLPVRAARATLPTVHIDDLGEGYRTKSPAILSPDLDARLEATLAAEKQAILFLNRRAYSPSLICRDCGFRPVCPRCNVSLSYHRRDGRMRCHHCGFQARPPDVCPKCESRYFNPFGIGTEKVEEAVARRFPEARVARLDRDVARKKGALEETLAGFRSGDLDILVGTQIVAKGLDFPSVTLVGVIAADVSLNLPDFRASERTFQLLSQVAGRAGRGIHPGEVVIQTFNPTHLAITTAQSHDYPAFYESLREERRAAGYPPFRRLVNIVLSGPSRDVLVHASAEIRDILATRESIEILGPVDCAMERIQNRWRRHLLLKLPAETAVAPIGEALADYHVKGVQIVIDVDPYSLM